MKIALAWLSLALCLCLSPASVAANPDVSFGRGEVNAPVVAYSQTIDIPVPPGSNGLQPTVQFSYSSMGGNGRMGVGWAMNTPRIERSTQKGAPSFTDADEFVLFMGGASHTLIKTATGEYRISRESLFFRIAKHPLGWKIESPQGLTYYLGPKSSATDHLAQDSMYPRGSAQPFSWRVSRVENPYGQAIVYRYVYGNWLTKIEYGPLTGGAYANHVEFAYEARADHPWLHNGWVPGVLGGRLASVKTYAQGQLAADFSFTYTTRPDDPRSLLTSVVRHAVDGSGQTQQTDFAYTGHNLHTLVQNWRQPGRSFVKNTSNYSYTYTFHCYVDFDGDGTNEHIYFPAQAWTFQINGYPLPIPSRGDTTQPAAYIDLDGDGLMDWLVRDPSGKIALYRGKDAGTFVATPPLWDDPAANPGTMSFADINGDGLPDRIAGNVVYLNAGDAFLTASTPYTPPAGMKAATTMGYLGGPNNIRRARVTSMGQPVWIYLRDRWERRPLLTKTRNLNTGLDTTIAYTAQPVTNYPSGKMFAVYRVATQCAIAAPIHSTRYGYTGGAYNVATREFRGFNAVTATDESNGMATTTTYHQDAVFTGRPRQVVVTTAGGAKLSATGNTWLSYNYDAGKRQFPYLRTTVATTWDLSGAQSSQTTATQTYQADGNLLGRTTKRGGGSTVEVVNTYWSRDFNVAQGIDNWYLHRLKTTTTTVTAPGPTPATQTRSTAFWYQGMQVVREDHVAGTGFGTRKRYVYDANGNPTHESVRSLQGGVETQLTWSSYEYDPTGTFRQGATNAKNHAEIYAYDPRLGVRTKLTGPNGLSTTWIPDGFGRIVREERPDGTATDIAYHLDARNGADYWRLQVVSSETGSGSRAEYVDSYGRSRLKRQLAFTGGNTWQYTHYDALGRVAYVTLPHPGGIPHGSAPKTVYDYDDLGRVISTTAPDGNVSRIDYLAVDGGARKEVVTDPLGHVTTRIHDADGRLHQVIDPLQGTLTYTYDAAGNLIQTKDATGNVTAMTYNILGQKTSMTDPDMGYWQYDYTPLGQLKWQKDNSGNEITLTYDTLGRLTQRVEPEGTSTWRYDAAWAGALTQETGPGGFARAYTYDGLGRTTDVTTTAAGKLYTVSTTYDGVGRVRDLTYPAGLTIRHTYAADGSLNALRNTANNALLWRADAVNAQGQITQEYYGNGLTTQRTFDPNTGALTAIRTGSTPGMADIQNLSYGVDALGNLSYRENRLAGWHEDFTYDELDRLTEACRYDLTTLATPTQTRSYSYNALGNLTYKSDLGALNYDPSHPHQVAWANGNNYLYDANGNLTQGAGRTITYTAFNQPQHIQTANATVAYTYDSNHQRLTRQTLTSRTVYIGKLFEELTPLVGSGVAVAKQTSYLYAAGRLVAVLETAGAIKKLTYLHTDHLGSPETLTDAQGLIVETLDFDPFGAPTTSGTLTTRGFTGHKMEPDLGLINMNARLYDPALDRFIQADTVVLTPYPFSCNLL